MRRRKPAASGRHRIAACRVTRVQPCRLNRRMGAGPCELSSAGPAVRCRTRADATMRPQPGAGVTPGPIAAVEPLGSDCTTSARRVEEPIPDPHPMPLSGERRLPGWVVVAVASGPVLRLTRDDAPGAGVAADTVALSVVSDMSTADGSAPQGVPEHYIDELHLWPELNRTSSCQSPSSPARAGQWPLCHYLATTPRSPSRPAS